MIFYVSLIYIYVMHESCQTLIEALHNLSLFIPPIYIYRYKSES